MLGTLSGNTHIVVSGVALIVPQSPPPAAGSDSHAVLAGSTVVVFHEATEVRGPRSAGTGCLADCLLRSHR